MLRSEYDSLLSGDQSLIVAPVGRFLARIIGPGYSASYAYGECRIAYQRPGSLRRAWVVAPNWGEALKAARDKWGWQPTLREYTRHRDDSRKTA